LYNFCTACYDQHGQKQSPLKALQSTASFRL
jgi:hypothetical protein